jgi:hypothetical protein
MNGTLGPRSLGDILRDTFTIYGRNFWRFVAIVSIVMVPYAVVFSLFILLMPMYGELETEAFSSGMFLFWIPIYLASFAASILMVGAVIHSVAQQHFNQPVSIGRAYSFAWRRLGDMLGAVILVGLAIAGILLIIVGIPTAIHFAVHGGVGWMTELAIIFMLIFIAAPAAIYLGITWSFVEQTALLEDCGPTSALSHSSALVKGSWWRVLGIVLLLILIVQAIVMILVMIFYIPAMIGIMSSAMTGIMGGTMTEIPPEPPTWLMLTPMIGGFIAGIISTPIYTIGHTLLYFDLRVRKQGYSLDALANELGLSTTT